MAVTVTPEKFDEALDKILNEYFDGVADEANTAVAEVSAVAVLDLKATSPKNRPKYFKGWKIKQTKKMKKNQQVEIYNTQKGLTHLLEHGHKKVNRQGKVIGFTAARPHIAKVEDWSKKELLRRLQEAAKGK